MRPTTLLLAVLLTPVGAFAKGIDGFYEVIEVSSTEGVRTAAELSPAGCWSREIFVIRGDLLSRGHQRLCGTGAVKDACEAWVTVQTTFQGGLRVPHAAEALTQSRTREWKARTQGELTEETRTVHEEMCSVRIDPAVYQVTMEKRGEANLIVLSNTSTGLIWRLQVAKPDVAPFSEVTK